MTDTFALHRSADSSSEAQNQVQCAFLLDVVVGQGSPVFQLFSGEDESLLVRRYALLVLDFRSHGCYGVFMGHIQRDGLSSQGLHEDLDGRHALLCSAR